ncbi:MAG TPA: hypothetical protein VIP46_21605 [Pyrinomonadaceae bacterium]
MKRMLRGAALLLALTLAPVFTAGAHDNGRRHRHGRKRTTTVHVNHRNPTPGVARRVRRGRNTTPRVRRGAINSNTRVTTPRRNRAGAALALEHGSGHGRMRPRVRVRN